MKVKVYFVTIGDAQDIRSWSGTSYYMAKSLEAQNIEIEYISNLTSINPLKFKLRSFFYNTLIRGKSGKYNSFYEPENLQHLADQVNAKLKKSNHSGPAIVFSPGAIPIAYLSTSLPIVIWTDATFAIMQDYYSEFTGLHKRTLQHFHSYEKNALTRASLSIFSSSWAAESAVRDYGAHPDRVKIIPFGANIECNRTVQDIHEFNKHKSRSVCKLLFIGKEWDRKGGETAMRVAEQLNKQHIQTELTVVGCTPFKNSNYPEYLKIKGFIRKDEKGGEKLMHQLYSESHFFILPTLAECTPIVFCEANSFGLPVLTTDTGGISSIIKNDLNGKMFGTPLNENSCVQYIKDTFADFTSYEKLSLSSFNEYKTNLNWDVSMARFIADLTSGPLK